MAQAANLPGSGSFLGFNTNASVEINETDSYILAGWVNWSLAGAVNTVMFGKGSVLVANNVSYTLRKNGANTDGLSTVSFIVRNGAASTHTVTSTDTISKNNKHFILAWVDTVAGEMGIQIGAGTPVTSLVSFTAFTDPGGPFRIGFQTSEVDLIAVYDEIFFCKNPPDMATALAKISNTIYNSGNGTLYQGPSTATKTLIGLVSWWGFDTSLFADDFNGNTFNSNGGLPTLASPLITQTYFERDFSESVSSSDIEIADFSKALADALTMSDIFIRNYTLNLAEFVFSSDAVATSPLLSNLLETIKFSCWLQVKLNPPVPHWNG